MSEPIKVGDLVIVLWAPHPEAKQYEGSIRTVSEASPNNIGEWRLVPATMTRRGSQMSWPPDRLRRIPPLSELEGQPTQEDIKEPA